MNLIPSKTLFNKNLLLQILNLSIGSLNLIQKKDFVIQSKIKKMKIKVFLILTTLAVLAMSGNYPDLAFNPNNCRIDNLDSWYVLKCPCGTDFTYQYSGLPEGWYAVNENLYIPKNRLQYKKVYGCKFSAYDRNSNRYLRRSLFLPYLNNFGRVYDQSYDLDFNDTPRLQNYFQNWYGSQDYVFYRDNRFNPQPQGFYYANGAVPNNVVSNYAVNYQQGSNVVVIPSTLPSNIYKSQYVNQVYYAVDPIANVNVNTVNTVINNNPYYQVYPSDDECNKVIVQANCDRIKDMVRYITTNKDSCKKRAEYLAGFSARIQNRIDSYRTDAENLKQNIFKLQAKLNELKEKSEKYQIFDNDEVNERIRKYRDQIGRFGREREEYQKSCRGTRESISQLRQEIQNIRLATGNSRRAVQEQEERLRAIDININQLQRKLAGLREDRQQSRRKRQYHIKIIEESSRRIDECNNKIGSHERYLNEYETKTKYWVTNIEDFNRKIEGCNKQVEGYSAKKGQYKSQDVIRKIAELEQEIALNQKQVEKLVSQYKPLEDYQDQFEETIEKHYVSCYNYLPPKNDKNKRGHYQIEGPAFQKYLKDTFGQAPNQNIRARFTGVVNIKRLSPLSVSWTKVYDIPSTVGYGSNMDQSQDNYKCTESDNLQTINAKILEINKNVIKCAGPNGQKFLVHVGGCTRMELVSEKDLPEIGQSILCKGWAKDPENYYAHHVTCF